MTTRSLRFVSSILISLLVFALAWDAMLYFRAFTAGETATPFNYAFNIIYSSLFFLGGSVGVWYARKNGRSAIGKALAFNGIGLIAWGIGLLAWAYYNLVLQVEIPYPSLADGFFVLIYPFVGLGIWYFLKIYQPLVTTRLVSESILIILFSAAVTFLINAENFRSPDLSLSQMIFTVLYPVGDVILLAGALIVLRVGGGKIQKGLRLVIAGILLETIADYLFTYRTIKETYWNGDIADTFYTLAAFTMGMGLLSAARGLLQRVTVPDASPPPGDPTRAATPTP